MRLRNIVLRSDLCRLARLADLLLFGVNLDLLVFDVQSEMVVNTHVLVSDPDKSEPGNQISTPIGEKKFEAGNDQKQSGNVMAEAVFAGEEIKKFAARKISCSSGLLLAIVPGFAKDFFMSDGPSDTGHRY